MGEPPGIKAIQRQPIRVGVIGTGYIGRLRMRTLEKTPGLSLDAIADTRRSVAEEAARAVRSARVLPDATAMSEDPGIDAVIVCTPPDTHEAIAIACLRGEKHVLCEKPLATSVPACETMIRAAATSHVSLATGFNLRFTRAARLAKTMLDAGAIGELDHIRSFHGHAGGSEFGHTWVHNQAVSGGGTLMDNGIHVIDLTRWLLGGVQEVAGFSSSHIWKKQGCEDNGFLVMRNERGRVAILQSSWTEWRGYGYRIQLYGSQGFIEFGYPPLFLVHGRRRENRKPKVRRWLFPAYQVRERLLGYQWGLIETLAAEMELWAEAMTQGSEPPVSGLDGLEAVRIARSATSV